MGIRLVSFLGLGKSDADPPYYSEALYSLDGYGVTKTSTPLVEAAIYELIDDIQLIIILGTKEVRKRWKDTGLLYNYLPKEKLEFIQVPSGKSTEDIWIILDNVRKALDYKAYQGEQASEEKAPDSIILDVTHGFRLQPIVGLSALNLALSEWKMGDVQIPPELRILYGAWEAHDKKNVAPIWDLTNLVDAARWTRAIHVLMSYGRADELNELCIEKKQKDVSAARKIGEKDKELEKYNLIKMFGERARRFADDLALNRIVDVLTKSSRDLLEIVKNEKFREMVSNDLPPLKLTISLLGKWIEPLVVDKTMDIAGIHASIELARLMGRLQRFASQAALIRESLVTYYQLLTKGKPLPEPRADDANYDELRKNIEGEWTEMVESYKTNIESAPERLRPIIALSNKSKPSRNDVAHCGMNQSYESSKKLRDKLKEHVEELDKLITSYTAEVD